MILFSRNNIELDYTSATCLLEVRWVGALVKNEFTLLWHQVIALAQQHSVRFILLDATQVDTPNSSAMEDQAIQSFFTQPLQIPSLEKIARVINSNQKYDQKMTRLYTNLQQQNKQVSFQSFQHYYQALDWLLGISWPTVPVKSINPQ